MARKRELLDDVQRALIAFFKKNTSEEGLTLREIASAIGVNHPQTVLNKLNQLVLKGYFVKDNSGYRLVRESVQSKFDDIIQIPVFGFAQCGNKGKAVIDDYSQEKIPVTLAFIGTSDVQNCFFVRAKGNSMEPKIQDGDLVLIRQQANYDPNDFVFIVHNELPKLKKIIKEENKFYLESVNRFFDKVELSKYDESKIIGVVKKIIKSV
ncbi:MAG TPA: S24 family peptidase [Candidatus Absconditabacterales bacterium]|nr:S24 family peptidase [Candidatus Absconditabacterales bacterium]HOQ79336.1 S24 family peptidase [Candidatus Absconditabacterales bacterium]HPK27958.1 S24 family peptidase [Candidatus Absconditabacterales bacterium]